MSRPLPYLSPRNRDLIVVASAATLDTVRGLVLERQFAAGMALLTPAQRAVAELRYGHEPRTLDEIGARLGMTSEEVYFLSRDAMAISQGRLNPKAPTLPLDSVIDDLAPAVRAATDRAFTAAANLPRLHPVALARVQLGDEGSVAVDLDPGQRRWVLGALAWYRDWVLSLSGSPDTTPDGSQRGGAFRHRTPVCSEEEKGAVMELAPGRDDRERAQELALWFERVEQQLGGPADVGLWSLVQRLGPW